ncbi:MAG: peptidase M50 [Candidatus Peregrinibacteria bacterium GW2011_GWC2_39_14]|nr:MAG: Peptidase M50 [Candidatus Peregrinibacteria bacterium GW2011_GWA2_38_36]KKR05890.1 MAG: peptidase M50 [Candidatus Peregrinibacteria bacterium GW2011_GWC2_39_14]
MEFSFNIINFIYSSIGFLIAITVHEFSHAYTADALGDPTPRLAGRVSLNPLRHLDVVGTMMIILIHFGWGKPVPTNPKYFRKPLAYSTFTAIVGPLSNLLLAILIAVFMKYTQDFSPAWMRDMFTIIIWTNIMLCVFNLIPIPPLDGSHLIGLFIPQKYSNAYMRFMESGQIYLILFIAADYLLISRWFGFSILESIVGTISNYLMIVVFLGA